MRTLTSARLILGRWFRYLPKLVQGLSSLPLFPLVIYRSPGGHFAYVDHALISCNASIADLQAENVIVLDTSAILFGEQGPVWDRYQLNCLHINGAGYEALNHELTSALQRLT